MLHRSSISWADYSGGPLNVVVRGRTEGECECSPGCDNCWARALQERFNYGPEHTTFYSDRLAALSKASFDDGRENRRGPGSRPVAFLCDTGDILHPAVSLIQSSMIVQAAARLPADFVLLTKRAGRLTLLDYVLGGFPDNVWVLVTICNQVEADHKIPGLLQARARVRGVCLEPMLGPVNIRRHLLAGAHKWRHDIGWVICGAESGPNRRPFRLAWAEDLYRQCQEAGVPFFGKQDSGARPGTPLLIGGREIHEWPELR
jgi:protein gp37